MGSCLSRPSRLEQNTDGAEERSSSTVPEGVDEKNSAEGGSIIDEKALGTIQFQGQREAVFGGGGEDEPDYDEKRDTTKSPAEIAFIDKCCKEKTIFTGMDKEQREAVIKQMYRMECPKDTKVIVEGDMTQEFFVVRKGSFDIFVKDEKVAESKEGHTFGELALLYDAPRAATVVANEDSLIFAVNRLAFRSVLRHHQKDKGSKIKAVLRNNEIFSKLHESKIINLETAFQRCNFEEDKTIIKQGEEGDKFYLIISGACEWTKKLPDGVIERGNLRLGDYFGERALITKEKRAATITTKTWVKTLALSKEDFNEIIGEGKMFKHRMTSYESKNELDSLEKGSEDTKPEEQPNVCSLQVLLNNTIGVLGSGAFGTVTLVFDSENEKSYALKAVKKCQIVKMRQQKHVKVEMKVMRKLATYKNPFLANLVRTYKDELRVYYLLEACLGGELFTILRKRRKFSEMATRFYVGCVIEAFDCMHSHNIIYRDLKPENLVLDNTGYAKVTDFGFAKVVKDKTFTLCGTPDYLAPEIVTGQGHNKGVDWWTLGILTYEMLASYPPFFSESPMVTYKKILKGRAKYGSVFSEPAKRFIASFLKIRPVKRQGMQPGGVNVMRSRTFFRDFNWAMLRARTMTPPIKNKVRSLKDISNFNRKKVKKDDAKPVKKEDDFDEDF